MSELPIKSNNELALERTELAQERTELAQGRNDLAEIRTELARERTRAAEERTLMAWIRTSLSMISFGFGIDRFFKYLDKTETVGKINSLNEERVLGISLMVLGVTALAVALVNHWFTLKNIEQRKFIYVPKWSQGFAVGVVLLFIGLASFLPLLTNDLRLRDIFTLDSQVINNLVSLTVFTIMLTMGVKIPLTDFTSLKKYPIWFGKSLLSVLVIFPLLITLIITFFDLKTGTFIALILLASAPAAPLLTRRITMANGNITLGASLQVVLSLLAVIFTPLILLSFSLIFAQYKINISFLLVAKQVAFVQFLPLSLGLILRRISADLSEEIGNFLVNIANTLFIVVVLLALIISLDLIPLAGWKAVIAIGFLTVISLAVGHFLGGVEDGKPLDTRVTLATATIARNIGLALYIAIENNLTIAIPSIIAYLIFGVVFSFPYNVWIKKQA